MQRIFSTLGTATALRLASGATVLAVDVASPAYKAPPPVAPMKSVGRTMRLLLLIPIVALALFFDGLSALMHKVADRVAPSDDVSDAC